LLTRYRRAESAQRHFYVWRAGAREQLASLKWQIAVAQIPFAIAFYFLVGPRILVWYAALLVAVGFTMPGIRGKADLLWTC